MTEYILGIPPAYQEIVGYDRFNWVDETDSTSTNSDVVGTFNADTYDISTAWGWTNEELLVDQGYASGTTPEVGSVFDVTNFGGGFENIYSDLVGAGSQWGKRDQRMCSTPLGFDITIPTTFDAAALALGTYLP